MRGELEKFMKFARGPRLTQVEFDGFILSNERISRKTDYGKKKFWKGQETITLFFNTGARLKVIARLTETDRGWVLEDYHCREFRNRFRIAVKKRGPLVAA